MPTSKAEIMHFMMKNKEHSKLIKEALSSPLGSTSREKANKMFSIMGKLTQANDGAGGPGVMQEQPQMMPTYPEMNQPVRMPESTKSMVIFHKIPTPKITYGKKFVDPHTPPEITPMAQPQAAQSMDGSGGPGVMDGAGGIGSFFSDAYDVFKNSISEYVQPDPVVKPTTSTLPAYNPSTPVNITKIQNPLVTTPSAFGPISTPTKTVPKPEPKGTIAKTLDWVTGTALPTIGLGATSAFAGAESAAEWLVRNGYNTAKNIGTNLFVDSSTPILNNSNYVPMGDTLGAKAIAALRDQAATYRAPTTSTTRPTTYSTGTPSDFANLSNTLKNNPAATNAPGTVTNQVKTDSAQPLGSNTYNSTVLGAGQTNNNSTKTNTNNSSVTYTPGSKLFSEAISTVESGSAAGNYKAVGKTMGAGSSSAGYAALGKYQIMPNFWFDKIGLNKDSAVDKQKFLDSPDLQDKLHQIIIDGLAKQYNNDPAKMAAAYFGGDLGVKNLGTVAGDKQSDGNMSVNQYVNKVLSVMGSGTSIASTKGSPDSLGSSNVTDPAGTDTKTDQTGNTNTQLTGLPGRIQDGIKNNLGAGMFALREMENKNNPISEGKSLSQLIADKDAAIRKDTGYDQLKTDKMIAEQEKVNLPKDMATFIRDRETYIATTDKNIEDFRAKMANMDMSNPDTRDSANKYLNYLYTLRGRQNQTYMGYIQQASDLQQRKVENLTNQLQTATDQYKTQITNYTNIKTSEYTTYMAALTDMYTTAKNAPTEALQLDYLKKQVTGAATLTPSDLLKQGFINQNKELAGIINDKNNLARQGVDLMERVQMLGQLDPSYTSANIFQTYVDGVNNYLNATPDAKGGVADRGVTEDGKKKIADEAIRNFAHVAIAASQSGDNQALVLATNHAYSVGQHVAKSMGDSIEGSRAVPALKKSIERLAPKSIFGSPKTPPSEAEFLKMVAEDTAGAIDESLAKSIYATFDRYRRDDGNKTTSALDAVHAMLYNTGSTSDRSKQTPFTDSEFASAIGNFYASMILQAEFAQDPKVQAQMNAVLMGN